MAHDALGILGVLAPAFQVSHRLRRRVRHVDRREISRTKKPREFHRVTRVGLHAVAGLLGYERRREDAAIEALRAYRAAQTESGGSRFVAAANRPSSCPSRQLSQGLYHVSRIARDLPDQLRRARIALGHGDRDALLVDVKTYESYLFHGPASCCGSAPPLCSCSVTRAFRRVGPPSCLVATKERRDRPLGHVVVAIKGADDPRLLDRRESAPGMQLAHLYGGLDGAELRDDGAKIAKAKP